MHETLLQDLPYTEEGFTLRDLADDPDQLVSKLASDLIEARHMINALDVAIDNAAEWVEVVRRLDELVKLNRRNRGEM